MDFRYFNRQDSVDVSWVLLWSFFNWCVLSVEDLIYLLKMRFCTKYWWLILFYVESLSKKSQQMQKRATCFSLHVPIILTVNGPLVISELSSKLPSFRNDHISPTMAILSRSFSGFPPGGDMWPFSPFRVYGPPGFRGRKTGSPANLPWGIVVPRVGHYDGCATLDLCFSPGFPQFRSLKKNICL